MLKKVSLMNYKKIIDVSNCYVIGDLHGEWHHLNKFVNKKNPSVILQCGDLGYWDTFDGKTTLGDRITTERGIRKKKWYLCKGIKNRECPVYWCDGNHEQLWSLRDIRNNNPEEKAHEVCENVFYMQRGSVMKLSDGRTVLFMGGAASIDKEYRTLGVDWFPCETISQNDIYDLPDVKVDIVISHTCPREFLPDVLRHDFRKLDDPSYDALSYILYKYNPSLWYFGHWHKNILGFYKNTKWFCLNMANHTGWFQKLLK